jgi:hypothetical protein
MPLERCPEDRHVLALAQFVGAQIVVTDEKDLIVEINALSGETLAMSADGFGCELLARRGTDALRGVIETMAAKRRRPPHTEADVWTVLADQVAYWGWRGCIKRISDWHHPPERQFDGAAEFREVTGARRRFGDLDIGNGRTRKRCTSAD